MSVTKGTTAGALSERLATVKLISSFAAGAAVGALLNSDRPVLAAVTAVAATTAGYLLMRNPR